MTPQRASQILSHTKPQFGNLEHIECLQTLAAVDELKTIMARLQEYCDGNAHRPSIIRAEIEASLEVAERNLEFMGPNDLKKASEKLERLARITDLH